MEWNPAKRLRVDLGVRLNVTSEEREQGDEDAGGGNDQQNHVRPGASAGVIWSAWERGPDYGRIFGNIRDTFKPAAIDFAIADEEEGVLKPETARSYEAGLKARALDGRVDFSASAFLKCSNPLD
jgi:outer membrane receptor protein involved in Fe transport